MSQLSSSDQGSVSILRIRSQGDRCLLIDVGEHIDPATGMKCLKLAHKLRHARLAGVLDIVPSFTSVAVFFMPNQSLGLDTREGLERHIERLCKELSDDEPLQARRIKIPICYGGEHGPDLPELASRMSLTPEQVIAAHCEKICRVYMLGFAPGHPYIGIHDERFAIPRREVPRTAVAAGSLGIANRQSTIYPNRLPGGWHIIGATPLRLFNAQAESPTLLLPGDEIEFRPIEQNEFERLGAAQQWPVAFGEGQQA
jgi:inhibitor of KinA